MLPAAVRHALRRWRRRPGLAITATLILAIGIGATTAMFSIVNAVLLTDEPWPDADRLVRVYGVLPQQRTNPAYRTTWNRSEIAWASWRDVQKVPLFAEVAAWVPNQQIVGDDQTELVRAFYASSTLPLIVGAQPALGRFFTAEEDEKDSGTLIISHRLWTRLFGADPNAIGTVTTVTMPGASAGPSSRRTIVGVLPETFTFPGDEPDILMPIGFHKYNGSFGTPFFRAIGRLRPDATVSAAVSAVEPLVRREDTPDRRTARVVTLKADRIGLGDRPLWLMLAGAALLLVVACSNVAGLLLSDARSRQHETAVRLALGGTRGAIVRQLMAEHAVLALAAGTSGVLLATWLIPSLTALAPPGLMGDQAVALDPRMAAWAVAAAVVTTLLAGLIPSTAISSTKPGDALKVEGRETTRGSRWRHRLVVAAQFSLALVLLVGAGLFGETLLRLRSQPLGFSPDRVAVVSVARPRRTAHAAPTPAEIARQDELLRRRDMGALMQMINGRDWAPIQSLLDRLGGLPGVRTVAMADAVPFTSALASMARVRSEDQRPEDAQLASYYLISAGYFDAMGIPVLRGRGFEPSDRGPSQIRIPKGATTIDAGAVVISRELERRAFDGSAVGQRLGWDKAVYDVVGVVADVRQRGVSDNELAALYIPLAQAERAGCVVVRATNEVGPLLPILRQTIEGHDTPMFVTATTPLSDLVASTIVVERSRALLSGMYGLVALLLASVGLYGLAARLVAERRREIGIRVALGAGPRDVRHLVMADAWMIVGIGLVVGIPAAIAASRLAQGMLYGVAPAAPHVLGIAALALAIAAIAATLVPAWRANRIDPAVTLREE